MTSLSASHPTLISTTRAISPSPERQLSQVKLILFSFGKQVMNGNLPIYFGVHIQSIQHIYGQTKIYSSGRTLAGIAHVEDQEITILDLCRYLSNEPLPETNYLLTLRTLQVDLIGIPLAESPFLVEVPLNKIRTLPTTYRHLDHLGIANQVAIAELEEGSQTAFLLDLERLVDCMVQTVEASQKSAFDSAIRSA
jgi:purine-binding chemotaxis protein CheW